MRKIFILLTLSMYGFLLFAQQAKKPTIMICQVTIGVISGIL